MGYCGGHVVGVVGNKDQHDSAIPPDCVHAMQDYLSMVGVQTLARLVEKQEPRVFGHRPRDKRYHPLTRGKMVKIIIDEVIYLELLRQILYSPFLLKVGPPV